LNILIAGDTSDYPFLQKKLRHFLKSIKKPILLFRKEMWNLEAFCFAHVLTSIRFQADETDEEMIAAARAFLLFRQGKKDMNLLKLAQKAKLQIRLIERS